MRMKFIIACGCMLYFHLSFSNAVSVRETADNTVGTFLQITDIHYDANFSTIGLVEDMCHIPLNSSYKPDNISRWGNFHCDTSWDLVVNAIQELKAINPNPDFIIWTGDTVPHVPNAELNMTYVFTLIRNTTILLRSTFPNTTIFPSIGNHDAFPADQVPIGPDSYYDSLVNYSQWDTMLTEEQLITFKKGGYYSADISSDIVMLVINNILWYTWDHEVSDNVTDPDQQFNWLTNQLEQARNSKRKVYISGHIPPGTSAGGFKSLTDDFNRKFVKLMQEFGDIVVANFFGHEHIDEFRIIYSVQREPLVPVLLAPAVTPGGSDHNPGLRLYRYDKRNGLVQDIDQYLLNLTDTIITDKPSWQKEYTFTEAYEVQDVSAESLDKIAASLNNFSSPLLQKYYIQMFAGYRPNFTQCDDQCKQSMYCTVTAVEYSSYNVCMADMFVSTNSPFDVTTIQPTNPSHQTVPVYLQIIVYCMVAVILLLFIFLSCWCFFRTRTVRQPRYVLLT